MIPPTIDSTSTANPRVIADGFGSEWKRCGPGCTLEVVRPGKVQCNEGPFCPNAGT